MRSISPLILMFMGCHGALAGPPKPRAPPPLAEVAGRLLGAAQVESLALETVTSLCDTAGARLAGSPALDRAIAWGTAWMQAHGFVHVHTEPVMVPVWIRGAERLTIESPAEAGRVAGTGPRGPRAASRVATFDSASGPMPRPGR